MGAEAAGTGAGANRRERWSHLFRGPLEPYRNKLVLRAPERPEVPAADLLDGERFDRLVEPFVERHGGADRRAVVSLWSQWYFSALVVPAVGVILRTGRRLPLALDRVEVLLDEEDHRPTGFRLPHGGRASGDPPGDDPPDEGPAGGPEAGPTEPRDDLLGPFRVLVRDHLAPLIEAMASRSGLSGRLLWNNAGTYFDWSVHELGIEEDGPCRDRADAGRRLLRSPTWPDGRENPLHGTVVRKEGCADSPGRRRICCLRYLVPGFERCDERCPLPG